MQQPLAKAALTHIFGEREAQAKRLVNQPLPLRSLFFRLLRRAFYRQARAFKLDIQIFLTETGQRKGNAIVVVKSLFRCYRAGKLWLSPAVCSALASLSKPIR